MKTYIASRNESGCTLEVQSSGETNTLQENGIDWNTLSRETLQLAWIMLADAFEGEVEHSRAFASFNSVVFAKKLVRDLPQEGWEMTDEEVRESFRQHAEDQKKGRY